MSAVEREITRAETQRRRGWEEKKLYGCFYESTAKNSALSFTRAMQFNYGRIVDKNESFETDEVKDIYAKYSLVKKGDIVINGLNLNYDVVSQRVAIVPKDGIITSAYIVLRPRPGTFSEYFCYLFKAMDSRKIFHGMGTGIRLTLSFRELKNMPIPLPPLPEQKKIVAYLDEETGRIDKAIAAEEKMIVLLQERREIVINEAVAPRDGWAKRRLFAIGRFSKGGGISRDDLQDEGEPAILYGDIYTKYEHATEVARNHISVNVAKASVRIGKGDLLMTGSGETKEDIGKTIVFLGEYAYIGGDVILFRLNSDDNDCRFVAYTLSSRASKAYRYKESKGEIVVHIYAGALKNLVVHLPSRVEQEEIVKRLDAETGKIDRAIEVKRRQIELLRERRQIVIDEAVTGKVKVA